MTDSAGDGAYGYMNSFKSRGKRIGYIGIGINEIHNQDREKAYRQVLDIADVVTLRDERSYRIAKSLTSNPVIRLTEDIVYLSDDVIRSSIECRAPRLLIAWRSLARYYNREIEENAIHTLVTVVEKHKDEYEEVIVAPLGNQVDVAINQLIYKMLSSVLSRVQYVKEDSFRKKIELIQSTTTVITGRLHGVFISEWNNINTIAIGYDTKVASFLESIGRIGDLVIPDAMNVESIEAALTTKHTPLTMADGDLRKTKSMLNVQLFEEMI